MEFLDMSATAALTTRAAFSHYVVMLLWFCESDFSFDVWKNYRFFCM